MFRKSVHEEIPRQADAAMAEQEIARHGALQDVSLGSRAAHPAHAAATTSVGRLRPIEVEGNDMLLSGEPGGERVHGRTCPLCEAMCGLTIPVRADGSIGDDPRRP
jgi:hypothetical protein